MDSTITRGAFALVAGLALLASAPAAASASWGEPLFLSPAGQDANSPDIAMDKDGDALAIWNRVDGAFNRVEVRPRSAAGVWGAVSPPLSPAGQHASDPQVALDEDGDALLIWRRSDGANQRVQYRTRSKTGVLGPVGNLSNTGADAVQPRVAVDDDGDAIVTWYRSDGANFRVQARTRTAAGTWSAITNLSSAGVHAYNPRPAIDDAGDGVVVWYRHDGTYNRVQMRAHPVAGPWGALQAISPVDLDASYPVVDMDTDGDAVIAWQQQDESLLQRVVARHRSAAGVFGAIDTLSDVTGSAPEVAMGPGGTATVVYQRDPGMIGLVEARLRAVSGAWGPVKVLAYTPGDAYEPHAAAGSGSSVAVWRHQDGDGQWRVEARQWAPSAWRPFTTLSGDDVESTLQDVAMEEVGGDAIVVWRTSDPANNFRIEAASGP